MHSTMARTSTNVCAQLYVLIGACTSTCTSTCTCTCAGSAATSGVTFARGAVGRGHNTPITFRKSTRGYDISNIFARGSRAHPNISSVGTNLTHISHIRAHRREYPALLPLNLLSAANLHRLQCCQIPAPQSKS